MDLIIFGALLHDIGKTNEYNDFSESKNYIARKGNGAELLGHSYEGTHIVDNYLEPASKVINNIERGEMYEFPKAGIPYYKSLNPYYN